MGSASSGSQRFIKSKQNGSSRKRKMSGNYSPSSRIMMKKNSSDFVSGGEVSQLTFMIKQKEEEILKLKKKVAQAEQIGKLYHLKIQENKKKGERNKKLIRENADISQKIDDLEEENVKFQNLIFSL